MPRVTHPGGIRKAHMPHLLAWGLCYAWIMVFATWHTATPASLLFFTARDRSVMHMTLLLTCALLICFVPLRGWRALARGGGAALLPLTALFLALPGLWVPLCAGLAMGTLCTGLLIFYVHLLNNTEKFYALLGGNALMALLGLLYQLGLLRGAAEKIVCGALLLAAVAALFLLKKEPVTAHGEATPKPTRMTYFSLFLNLGFAAMVLGGGILMLGAGEQPPLRYAFASGGMLAGCGVYFAVFAWLRRSLQTTWSVTFASFFLAMFLRALWPASPCAALASAALTGVSGAIGFLNMYYNVGVVGKKFGMRSHLALTLWCAVLGGGFCVGAGLYANRLDAEGFAAVMMAVSAVLVAAYFILSPVLSRSYFAERWVDDAECRDVQPQTNAPAPAPAPWKLPALRLPADFAARLRPGALLDRLEGQPGGGAKYPLFSAFSFVAFCCWYIAYFQAFADSPIAAALRPRGIDPAHLESAALLAGALGIALLFLRPRLLTRRGVKAAVLLCAFLPFQCIALAPRAWAAYALALLGGLALGMAAGRAVYSMLFFLVDHHPARAVAAGGLFIQLYIHAYAIAPIRGRPWLFYAVQALTLAAGLFFSYLFDADEAVRRRVLPDTNLRPSYGWPLFALFVLIQACFALYGTALLPLTPPESPLLRILPGALVLPGLWVWGRRLTVKGALLCFTGLLAGALAAFLATEGRSRFAVQLFMEPAFLFAALLYLWLLFILFQTYGRSLKRLRAWLLALAALHFAAVAAARALSAGVNFTPRETALLLPAIVLIAMLVPAAERVIQSMEAQCAYAQERGEGELLPDQREDVLALREKFLRLTPQLVLTEPQRRALAYLIDGQDADVMAHFMGLRLRKAQQLARETLEAVGFNSNAQLLLRLGALRAEPKPADYTALFDTHGLTQREREICALLLTTGGAQKHIAGQLGLSADTVKFHVKNIYRKLGVQSRTELTAKFAGAEAVTIE